MKLILYILILAFPTLYRAQVGINTTTPHPSSLLDINTSDKGLTLPQYNLITLDSPTDPIHNPAEGLLIYNNGNNHPKGIYFWNGVQWSKLHTKGDFNEVFALGIDMYSATNTALVNSTSPNLNLKDYKTLANTISGSITASVNNTTGFITLPKGNYTVHVKLDGVIQNKTNWSETAYLSGTKNRGDYHNIAVNAVIQDGQNINISDVQYGNQLLQTDGLYGYEYYFVIQLNQNINTVQLKLFYDILANTFVNNTNANLYPMTPQQSGLKITFNRIK